MKPSIIVISHVGLALPDPVKIVLAQGLFEIWKQITKPGLSELWARCTSTIFPKRVWPSSRNIEKKISCKIRNHLFSIIHSILNCKILNDFKFFLQNIHIKLYNLRLSEYYRIDGERGLESFYTGTVAVLRKLFLYFYLF